MKTTARSTRAPLKTDRLLTVRHAAVLAASAAALTFAVTLAVVEKTDNAPATADTSALAETRAPSSLIAATYGSADSAEHWLTASPAQPHQQYGTADSAEHWLTASPAQPHQQYGTADSAEHWLAPSPAQPHQQYGTADSAEHWLT